MKELELNRGGSRFVCTLPAASYSFSNGVFELKDLRPALYMNGRNVPFGPWKAEKVSETALTLVSSGKGGKWELKAALDAKGKLTLALNGRLSAPCEDLGVWYFEDAAVSADHIAVQTSSMGGGHLIPLKEKGFQKQDFTAATMLLLTKKGTQLALSFPLMGEHLETVSGTAAKGRAESFRAGFVIKHITAKTFKLKPMTLRVGDGFRMLAAYGDENKTEDKDFSQIVAPGWNSWDYYRWTVTEDEVMENAEFIAHDPVLSKHVKKIIVDDGWQYAYGEWKANSYFPHGMKWLAKNIKKLGFKPGLWICPTIAEPHSWIAQMEPDMLGKAENGQPTLCFDCMRR